MSLSESLKKFAASAAEKGKDLAEQGKKAMDDAADKAKDMAEQRKLTAEIQKQAQIIMEAKSQIGAYVVDNNLLDGDEFVLGQLSVIAAAQEVQEKNNARIAELKAAAEEKKAERAAEKAERTAAQALKAGFIDGICRYEEYEAQVLEKAGVDTLYQVPAEENPFAAFLRYFGSVMPQSDTQALTRFAESHSGIVVMAYAGE